MTDECYTTAANCTPGRWYRSEKWGRVLCCGTADPGEWLVAFAVRTYDLRTIMKYLRPEENLYACPQGWSDAKGE